MAWNEILLKSLKRAIAGGVLLAALYVIKTIWW